MESSVMVEMDDWKLITQAARGNMDAFTKIVQRYQKPIIGFCYHMTGSQMDAEDAAQESFVRLYTALPRLRPDKPFSTVLFAIARNTSLNHIRSRSRHQRRLEAMKNEPPENPIRQPDRHAQAGDIKEALKKIMETLPIEYKEALVLREYQGFDYQHISEILACPVGTVRSRLARARELVRTQLTAYGEGAL